jgi:hypothetical protein
MPGTKDYRVIYSKNMETLMQMVTSALNQGYQPTGGILVVIGNPEVPGDQGAFYFQAVWR